MISAYVFNNQGKLDRKEVALTAIPELLADPNSFVWVDLQQPTPDEAKSVLESVFHFHPLSIEDCIAVSHAPKVEEYKPQGGDTFPEYLFLVVHAVNYNQTNGAFATSDLDMFIGKKFLVTYHDVPLRTIDSIKSRCANSDKIAGRGPDRLAQSVLETLVENYKPALDKLSVRITELEQSVLENPTPAALPHILQLKKEVTLLRQIISAQQDVMERLGEGEFSIIRPQLVTYYRNVYDALFQISNLAQTYADSLTGILQVYLSLSSNQTGEVVKVLTLITVITTPLMMVGTWYGMNFKDMPELSWQHGYAAAAALVAVSTAATFWYFKKKKWF